MSVLVVCMIDTEFGRYAFPQKTYELISCKTPFVTANIGALSELLKNYAQCLYQSEDLESLINSIQSQLDNPVVPNLTIPSWEEQGRILLTFLEEHVT